MGMDAIFKVVAGIKYQDVRDDLIKIFEEQELTEEDLTDFLIDNDFLYGYWYDNEFVIGCEIYNQDWEYGIQEMEQIDTVIDIHYDEVVKTIDNFKSDTIGLTKLKEDLKIMMDCMKVYCFCDYR